MAHADDLIVAGALGPLSPGDEAALQQHLATCARCRSLDRDMTETAADLALDAPSEPLAPAYVARVLSVVRSEPAPRPPRRGVRALVAAALVGVLALGGLSAFLGVRLGDERAERERVVALVEFISDPSAAVRSMRAPDGGRLLLAHRDDGRALLVGQDLRLPDGHVFEIWLFRGPTVVPAGVFVPEDGAAVVEVRFQPGRDIGFAVTVEPARVERPTSAPVFQGSFAA